MKHWPLSLLLLLPLSVLAAPAANTTAAVSIEADRMELDQKQGTSHYHGNVVLQQGGLQIKADSITLYSEKKKLQRAVAKGNPATLLQQSDDNKSPLRATALHMEYLPQSEKVKLKGQAQLWRDGNKFSGELISYDLKQRIVKATGDKQGDGRVRVLLQPESAKDITEDKP